MANPMVVMPEWEQAWCRKHDIRFRNEWPKGTAFAMLGLFHAAAAEEQIVEAAGHDTVNLTGVFAEYSPLCCLIGDDMTKAVVDAALDNRVFGLDP